MPEFLRSASPLHSLLKDIVFKRMPEGECALCRLKEALNKQSAYRGRGTSKGTIFARFSQAPRTNIMVAPPSHCDVIVGS